MKKFPLIITFFTIVCISFLSCIENEGEEYWEKYKDWREANQLWLEEQALIKNADGSSYYEVLNPVWDKKSYVLIHYFNDRNLTKNNLSGRTKQAGKREIQAKHRTITDGSFLKRVRGKLFPEKVSLAGSRAEPLITFSS